MIILNENLQKGIDVRDMKDGEIAIIVSERYENLIVQRFGDTLISLGKSSEHSWCTILTIDRSENIEMYVRVLQKGETLTIK
jgi:hypothetical protein